MELALYKTDKHGELLISNYSFEALGTISYQAIKFTLNSAFPGMDRHLSIVIPSEVSKYAIMKLDLTNIPEYKVKLISEGLKTLSNNLDSSRVGEIKNLIDPRVHSEAIFAFCLALFWGFASENLFI